MKRIFAVLILTVMLLTGACSAEPADTRTRAEAAVAAVLENEWMPKGVTPSFEERETWWDVALNDTASGEAKAFLRIDKETGRVIRFCIAGFQMPALPASGLFFGWEGEDTDKMSRAEEKDKRNRGWPDLDLQVYEAFRHKSGYTPIRGNCAAEDCCLSYYGDYHGDLYAAAVFRMPENGDEEPQLMAYADVTTNRASGYDGCLTAEQAESAAREALRGKFGDDVADALQTDAEYFVVYDYFLLLELADADPLEAGNTLLPVWFFVMIDPRADEEGDRFDERYRDRYEYRIAVDARSGEIIEICEEPESFGVG